MRTEGNGRMITDWLEEHGDPEIEAYVEKNLEISERVHHILEEKGWTQADLAKAMEKSTSEVSKWLTGLHNLTLKSIVKMEMALGQKIIFTEAQKDYQYVYLGKIYENPELIEKWTYKKQ